MNKNSYKLENQVVKITTAAGDEFIIDMEDFEKVKQYCWCRTGSYFMAWSKKLKRNIYLHRLIMNVHESCDRKTNIVDHINQNTTDNRKANLRLCSIAKNLRNVPVSKRNTSGYKGVSWNIGKEKWQATIRVDKKLIMLGMFKKIEDAIKARLKAEAIHFGEYASNGVKKDGV